MECENQDAMGSRFRQGDRVDNGEMLRQEGSTVGIDFRPRRTPIGAVVDDARDSLSAQGD